MEMKLKPQSKYNYEENPERLKEWIVSSALIAEDMYIVDHNNMVRAGQSPKPTPGSLEDHFFHNSGNLCNGYIYALFSDILINTAINQLNGKFSDESLIGKIVNYFGEDKNRINITSGILSSLAIGFFETSGIGNTPDLKDIPAGIAGALLHTGLRYYSLKKQINEQTTEEISYQID